MNLDSSFEEIEEQIQIIQKFLTPKKYEAMELQTTARDEDYQSLLSNNAQQFCQDEQKNQILSEIQNAKEQIEYDNMMAQQVSNKHIAQNHIQAKNTAIEPQDSKHYFHRTWMLNLQCKDTNRYNYMAKKSKKQEQISFKYQKTTFKLVNNRFEAFKQKKDLLVVPYNVNFGQDCSEQSNKLANFIRQELTYQILYELQRNKSKSVKVSQIISLEANGLENVLGIYWLKLPLPEIDKYVSYGQFIQAIKNIQQLAHQFQDESIIIPYLHWPKIDQIEYFQILLNKLMQSIRNFKKQRQFQIIFMVQNQQQYELFSYHLKKIKYEYLRHGPQY